MSQGLQFLEINEAAGQVTRGAFDRQFGQGFLVASGHQAVVESTLNSSFLRICRHALGVV